MCQCQLVQFHFRLVFHISFENVSFNDGGMGYCMWAIKRQHCSWTGVILDVSFWRITGITTSNACQWSGRREGRRLRKDGSVVIKWAGMSWFFYLFYLSLNLLFLRLLLKWNAQVLCGRCWSSVFSRLWSRREGTGRMMAHVDYVFVVSKPTRVHCNGPSRPWTPRPSWPWRSVIRSRASCRGTGPTGGNGPVGWRYMVHHS